MDSRDNSLLEDDEETRSIIESVGSIPTDPPTVPVDVNFTPFNHFTTQVPKQSEGVYPQFEFNKPIKEKPSFLETFKATAEETNAAYRASHAAYESLNKPTAPYDSNFNPLNFQDKFINIDPKYYPYLMGSSNEQEMDFRLKRIYEEQQNNDAVKNGSWTAYLAGLGAGFATDPISYIPVIGWAKYASLGKTALVSAARSFPGVAAYSTLSNVAKQVDKIDGSFQKGLIDTVIDTTVGMALFGTLGAASLTVDKSALWGLRSFLADEIEGIGYKLKIDKDNKVLGAEAYDMTGGTLSADRVKIAQDKADSTFSKTGLFKIPIIGDKATQLLGNSLFGSTILRMLNSPYKTIRAIYDLSYDHGIITQGLEKGVENPDKFFTKLKQTFAQIRAQESQINALWMERNGFELNNYVGQKAAQAGMYTRDTALDIMGKNLGDKAYIDRPTFFSEIEEVLYTENKSAHNAVNEAANILRKQMDKSWSEYRKAYNLPEDWMPPRTAQGYLMRVYDTQFLNNNEDIWIREISNYLRESDQTIIKYSQPINDVSERIKHTGSLYAESLDKVEKKKLADELVTLKAQKKALEENLQNEIRTNPELQLHAEDWNALSADEAKELVGITKPRDVAQQKLDAQRALIKKTKDPKLKVTEAAKIAELEQALEEELQKLQELAASGAVNRRFYYQPKDSNVYIFREPSERLKLRKTYHEQQGYRADEEQAHKFREEHAKAYYNTILNQTAEDTINQIMGKFTGNGMENHTKARTLMIPDEILYKNNFMTKDLLAKVANYQSWLDRRTHFKNTYRNVTLEGGFEPLLRELDAEFQANRQTINNAKEKVKIELNNENLTAQEKRNLNKKLDKLNLDLNTETKNFNRAKKDANFAYEKMMGISKLGKTTKQISSGIRSGTVAANLGFLPLTMITDLSANGLKHGVLPFLRDGIYPTIQSLGGFLKTKDSEFLRNGAAALNLALQHLGSAYAEKNIGLMTNPYVNMGKIPASLDKIAHFSSNLAGTNFIDNMLQRVTSSVAQSEAMRLLSKFVKDGKLSARDMRWLNRYGLNAEKDAKRMVDAFKKNGGGKTSLGGYQSNFWHWEDLEAANKFGDAVYRATHDTIISAHAFDTPMWMDENGALGIMGPIFKGFRGWAFGSLNRYVIPFLQKPDPSQFIGVIGMLAAGALVSPSRRLARGEEPYPPNMTNEQWMYEVVSDSAFFSYFMSALNDANVLTKGGLLGDLKNDKYRDRTRVGLLGPAWGDVNNLADSFGAFATGTMSEQDALKMARMVPPFNTVWTYWMSKAVIEQFGLPKTHAIAQRQG